SDNTQKSHVDHSISPRPNPSGQRVHMGQFSVKIWGSTGSLLSGNQHFPYNSRAVLSDGGRTGRPRKEQFASGAFRYSVENNQEVHLLVGHSFDRPLASRGAGTLELTDTDEALMFAADIAPELEEVGYVRDVLAGLAAGLIVGISPGFRIPPERTVPNAETVEEEPPEEGEALIRTIHEAILFELSLVTRPAYSDTQVEARNWTPAPRMFLRKRPAIARWRP
ncbi:MAG: HK97 family phage prohead protease, partial [Roseovarius sp.]